MKTILFAIVLLSAIHATAQSVITEKTGEYYLLKVYVKPKPANIQYALFDTTFKQIPLRVNLQVSEDSVLLFLPKGKLYLKIRVNGLHLNLQLKKQEKPDTLIISNLGTSHEKIYNSMPAIRL